MNADLIILLKQLGIELNNDGWDEDKCMMLISLIWRIQDSEYHGSKDITEAEWEREITLIEKACHPLKWSEINTLSKSYTGFDIPKKNIS